MIEASTILFFGYLGFDFITTISEEAKNPKKDIPIAIQVALFVSMGIYVLITFTINGVGNLAQISSGDGETAIAEIFAARGMAWMAIIIYIAALLGITAASLTNLMSQTRILYSQAKDGRFFRVFKKLDPVKKVPVHGAWLSVIPYCICTFFMNLTELAKLCSLGTLITYGVINTAVIVLRLTDHGEDHMADSDSSEDYFDLEDQAKKVHHMHRELVVTWGPYSFIVLSFIAAYTDDKGGSVQNIW